MTKSQLHNDQCRKIIYKLEILNNLSFKIGNLKLKIGHWVIGHWDLIYMCLAYPGKIIELNPPYAMVDFDGLQKKVNISLVPGIEIGDNVIIHAGFAIQKLNIEQAESTKQIFKDNQLKARYSDTI